VALGILLKLTCGVHHGPWEHPLQRQPASTLDTSCPAD
jgi:hypothetical protein